MAYSRIQMTMTGFKFPFLTKIMSFEAINCQKSDFLGNLK